MLRDLVYRISPKAQTGDMAASYRAVEPGPQIPDNFSFSVVSRPLEDFADVSRLKPRALKAPHYRVNQQALANLVGAIALFLPIGLWIAGERHLACMRDSISHFYYAPFYGSVFVAALAMIGAFLWAYRTEEKLQNRLAALAGCAALGIALFPTSLHGCAGEGPFVARGFADFAEQAEGTVQVLLPAQAPITFQLAPWSDYVHYLSAGVMFAFLGWYCWRVLSRVDAAVHLSADARLSPEKTTRNLFYLLCGAVIFAALGMMGANFIAHMLGASWDWWDDWDMTFWLEFAGLMAFGVSWIVKGRLFGLFLFDKAPEPRAPYFWAMAEGQDE